MKVRLSPDGASTRVQVAYDLTSLGSEGDEAVRSMDESGFADMLEEWHRLIRAALKREAIGAMAD